MALKNKKLDIHAFAFLYTEIYIDGTNYVGFALPFIEDCRSKQKYTSA